MMKNLTFLGIICTLSVGILVMASSCKHESVQPVQSETPQPSGSNNPTNPSTGFCSPDTMYYNRDIAPILLSNCATSGCHNSTSAQDGVDLSNYAQVMATGGISPFNATSSKLIKVLYENGEDQMPPSPANHLPSEVVALLEKWINQGALNLTCNDTLGCDSVNITYSQHISPILATNCVGCHSGSTPQGGIDLGNYANIKIQADNGNLVGSVSGQPGYVAMPPGGASIGSCKISQISIWVNNGAPNN